MKDRVPTKPNRYAVYDDSHNLIGYQYHERADEPTEAGTPLNKATLLTDTTATALGLSGNPTVNDAFMGVANKVDDAVEDMSDALDAKKLLYEKIRDIPDASASTTLSISVSDIDWSVWREIRIMGRFYYTSSAVYTMVRINSISDSIFGTTSFDASVGASNSNGNSRLFYISSSVGVANARPFDISFKVTPDIYAVCHAGADNPAAIFAIAARTSGGAIASINTINLVASSGAGPAITNTSLWGIRR